MTSSPTLLSATLSLVDIVHSSFFILHSSFFILPSLSHLRAHSTCALSPRLCFASICSRSSPGLRACSVRNASRSTIGAQLAPRFANRPYPVPLLESSASRLRALVRLLTSACLSVTSVSKKLHALVNRLARSPRPIFPNMTPTALPAP